MSNGVGRRWRISLGAAALVLAMNTAVHADDDRRDDDPGPARPVEVAPLYRSTRGADGSASAPSRSVAPLSPSPRPASPAAPVPVGASTRGPGGPVVPPHEDRGTCAQCHGSRFGSGAPAASASREPAPRRARQALVAATPPHAERGPCVRCHGPKYAPGGAAALPGGPQPGGLRGLVGDYTRRRGGR